MDILADKRQSEVDLVRHVGHGWDDELVETVPRVGTFGPVDCQIARVLVPSLVRHLTLYARPAGLLCASQDADADARNSMSSQAKTSPRGS